MPRFLAGMFWISLLWGDMRQEWRKAQPDIFALEELAAQGPSELGADAMLRLVEKGRVKDPRWQKDLVERAFTMAGQAREPLLRRPVPGLPVDAGLAGPALELDRLSLQTRAVFQMAKLDENVAQKMFREIARPVPRRITCTDATYEDISAYVAMLRVFGTVEDKLAFVSGINSHAELAPAASLSEEEVVRGGLLAVLQRVEGEERLFTGLLPGTLAALRPLGLEEALREYVTRNLKAPACEESTKKGWQGNTREEAIRTLALPPDLQPGSVEGAAAVNSWLQEEPQTQREFQELLFKQAERHTPAWQDRFIAFLRRVDDGKPNLSRRAQILSAAAMAAPPGHLREGALDQLIRTLVHASELRERPLVWAKAATELLRVASTFSEGEYAKVLGAYENSRFPNLVLEARLQRMGV